MNRLFYLTIVILLAVLPALTGCAKKDSAWLVNGHAFVPADSTVDYQPTAGSFELPEEKPIVKIITGREVAGIEEAQQIAAADNQPARPAGLNQEVTGLALKKAPLAQVAALLTELCQYNIAVTEKAADLEITLFLENLPLRQALEAVCRLNGLWYREDERIITLMTSREYSDEMVIHRNEKTRAFWLRYTNANDMAKVIQAVMGAQVEFIDIGGEEIYGYVKEDSSGGGGGAGAQEKELGREEKEKLLALGGLRGGKGDALEIAARLGKNVPAVITVFKRNNSILARSLDEAVLAEIGRIIETMDTPTNQVLLEMTILQVTLGDDFKSFFDINYPGNNKFFFNTMETSNGTGDQTLSMFFANDNIYARLELFTSENRVEVLATPFLMSANNARVEFFVGEETPLRDDVESKTIYDDEGNPVTTIYTVNIIRKELGTDVEISSFINEDGTITMDFKAELSVAKLNMTEITVSDENTGGFASFPLDGVDRSELTSIITASSGQPLVIGGIIKEQLEEYEKKVPILGDLPLIGFFFRDIADKKIKTETVIILVPHIIRHPALAWQVGREFLNRRSSHPRIVREKENILDYPTANEPGEEETDHE